MAVVFTDVLAWLEPPRLIPILRMLVLVGWSFVVMWSPGAARDLVGGRATKSALVLTGLAIIGFQLNALAGAIVRLTDYWTAALLVALSVAAAIFIFVVLLPRSPGGDKGAVVVASLAIVASCIVGGSLA